MFSARFMEKIMEPTRGRRPMAVGASPPGQGAKKRPFFAPLTLPPENGPRRGEGWPRAGGRPGNSLKRKSTRPPGGPSWQGAKKLSICFALYPRRAGGAHFRVMGSRDEKKLSFFRPLRPRVGSIKISINLVENKRHSKIGGAKKASPNPAPPAGLLESRAAALPS